MVVGGGGGGCVLIRKRAGCNDFVALENNDSFGNTPVHKNNISDSVGEEPRNAMQKNVLAEHATQTLHAYDEWVSRDSCVESDRYFTFFFFFCRKRVLRTNYFRSYYRRSLLIWHLLCVRGPHDARNTNFCAEPPQHHFDIVSPARKPNRFYNPIYLSIQRTLGNSWLGDLKSYKCVFSSRNVW